MFASSVAALALAAAPLVARAEAPATGKALAAACKGRDGWADAAPPARVIGNTYYVGTCGITVLLIASPKGHVLIDSGPPEAAPIVLANIRRLGFRPRDVRLIVGSHEHVDHMGGLATLKAATGARIMLREPARGVVETGKTDAADPQAGGIPDMAPAVVDGLVADGERIGPRPLTAVATPGHTSGGTSWRWTECEKARCLAIAYVDSVSAVSRDGYRFSDHPERVAPYRTTLRRIAALPCDVLITPHPGVSNFFARLAGAAPLRDSGGCRRLAEGATAALDQRLAREGTSPAR